MAVHRRYRSEVLTVYETTFRCVVFATVAVACASQARVARLTVDLGELVLIAPNGRGWRGAELVGATFQIGDERVRLDEIRRDGDAWLHRVAVTPDGRELCTADADGQHWAIPIVGDRGVEWVCTSGAIGKCIRWGYAPWRSARLHAACVRMARADYGGDGTSATRAGIRIAFCDRAGIRRCPVPLPPLEAVWSQRGANCVVRPRIAELVTLAELAAAYPRLRGHLGSCAVSEDPSLIYQWRVE
jgi:hypothetical protein